MQKFTIQKVIRLAWAGSLAFLMSACDEKAASRLPAPKVQKPETEKSQSHTTEPRPQMTTPPEAKHPFQFVETKTENSGFHNVMDLYSYSGELKIEELKDFCLDRKAINQAKVFYFVVIFDEKENAKFPSTPFTAAYGSEEDSLRHIRAIYTFNRVNGFSELRYHEKNIWDYVATTEKL